MQNLHNKIMSELTGIQPGSVAAAAFSPSESALVKDALSRERFTDSILAKASKVKVLGMALAGEAVSGRLIKNMAHSAWENKREIALGAGVGFAAKSAARVGLAASGGWMALAAIGAAGGFASGAFREYRKQTKDMETDAGRTFVISGLKREYRRAKAADKKRIITRGIFGAGMGAVGSLIGVEIAENEWVQGRLTDTFGFLGDKGRDVMSMAKEKLSEMQKPPVELPSVVPNVPAMPEVSAGAVPPPAENSIPTSPAPETPIPIAASTATPTPTEVQSIPAATATSTATPTPTPTPTPTATPTIPAASAPAGIPLTETPIPTATATASPTLTPTPTSVPGSLPPAAPAGEILQPAPVAAAPASGLPSVPEAPAPPPTPPEPQVSAPAAPAEPPGSAPLVEKPTTSDAAVPTTAEVSPGPPGLPFKEAVPVPAGSTAWTEITNYVDNFGPKPKGFSMREAVARALADSNIDDATKIPAGKMLNLEGVNDYLQDLQQGTEALPVDLAIAPSEVPLPSGSDPWSTTANYLEAVWGEKPSSDEIKFVTQELCRQSDIAVPDWDIAGKVPATNLPPNYVLNYNEAVKKAISTLRP